MLQSLISDEEREEEVVIRPHAVKVNHSPGPDGTRPLVVRVGGAPVSSIPRLSSEPVSADKLPWEWEKVNVFSLFKRGYRQLLFNLPEVCQCQDYGTSGSSQLTDHIESHRFQQHRFWRQRSCVPNLFLACESWSEDNEAVHPADFISVDFSEAFDKIFHGRLLLKLLALITAYYGRLPISCVKVPFVSCPVVPAMVQSRPTDKFLVRYYSGCTLLNRRLFLA